ncbi:MAG: hypothetical protein GPOALKHO_001034 [Sodalis sp.]|nr:MAG: hypothetical protein GPOALKHO_001034 [Sodalis sp.]
MSVSLAITMPATASECLLRIWCRNANNQIGGQRLRLLQRRTHKVLSTTRNSGLLGLSVNASFCLAASAYVFARSTNCLIGATPALTSKQSTAAAMGIMARRQQITGLEKDRAHQMNS